MSLQNETIYFFDYQQKCHLFTTNNGSKLAKSQMRRFIFSLLILSITASNNPIIPTITIEQTRNHIAQEKIVIAQLAHDSLIAYKKAKLMIKSSLNEHYLPLKLVIKKVINKIIVSDEFSYSITKITDYQVQCIVDEHMMFNDITYNPADYPMGQKIDQELALAFPEVNQTINTVFNVFYVTLVNCRGCQLLLEKLTVKEQSLIDEIESLNT